MCFGIHFWMHFLVRFWWWFCLLRMFEVILLNCGFGKRWVKLDQSNWLKVCSVAAGRGSDVNMGYRVF